MNKRLVSLCVILMFLLIGCGSNPDSARDTDNFDKINSELLIIPREYKTDDAINDGFFVIVHGNVKSKFEIMDKFVSESQNRKPASITIVQYTDEGDPIIARIVFDGTKYYGVEDHTRDTFGSKEYQQFEFSYLKVFEDNDSILVLLFNDNKVTYDDYIKSMLSSHSKDWIEHKLVCSYKK